MQYFLSQLSRLLGAPAGPSTINFSALIALAFVATILISVNVNRRYIE